LSSERKEDQLTRARIIKGTTIAAAYVGQQEAGELRRLEGQVREDIEVQVQPVNLQRQFDQVIVTPASPPVPGQPTAATLVSAAAHKVLGIHCTTSKC
jgi:hypothetical protein